MSSMESYFKETYSHHLNYNIYPTDFNTHEIAIISIENFDKLVKEQDFRQSMSVSLKKRWAQLRDTANIGTSYYSTADDMRTMFLVGAEFGVGTKVYLKEFTKGAPPHIVMNLTTRIQTMIVALFSSYQHRKTISMGIGVAGAKQAAKAGGFLTVVLLTSFHIVDYVLRDNATIGQLIGSIASDVAKAVTTFGASVGTLSFITTTPLAPFLAYAIGPLVIVILVSVAFSFSFYQLEKEFHLTEKLNKMIDQSISNNPNAQEEIIYLNP